MRIAVAVLVTLLWITAPPPTRAEVFDAETFTLDNGLQVVAVTNRLAPVVTHMLWYRVGSADDPPGRSGLAHYTEHLMFLGTDAYPEGEFSRLVQRNGGRHNAFTSSDVTAYHQSIAVDRLALVMGLEADRMRDLAVAEDRALVERDVVLQERLQRTDNSPSGQLNEQMLAALYQHHPYGVPVIGWGHEIETLTLDDALAFQDRWYVPNNAIVVVAGDIDAETLRPLVEAAYGDIPRGPDIARARLQEPPPVAPRRVTLEHPDVQQADLWRYYLSPAYGTADDPATPYALQVLSELFGGGLTSRLYRSLVAEQGVAVSAGSFYAPVAVDDAQFGLFVTPRGGVDLAELEAAVDAEIDRLLTDGVTEEEVADARGRLTIQAVYARDSVGGAARVIGRALTTGQTLDDVQSWPERIEAVTPAQVDAAAALVFDPRRSVTGWMLPGAPPPPMADRTPTPQTTPGSEESQ